MCSPKGEPMFQLFFKILLIVVAYTRLAHAEIPATKPPVFDSSADIDVSHLCPEQADNFELYRADRADLLILNCYQSSNYLVLSQKTQEQPKKVFFKIIKTIAKNSPAAYFLTNSQQDDSRNFMLFANENQIGSIAFFAGQAESNNCKGYYELFSVRSPFNLYDFSVETPQATGLCYNLAYDPNAKQIQVNISDIYVNYDDKKTTIDIALYFKDWNKSDSEEISILRLDTATRKFQILNRLNEQKWFPQNCGTYLFSVKFIPQANKVSLVYANSKIFFVDYNNRDLKSEVKYDGSKNVAATCEGHIPFYSANVSNTFLDEWNKTISFLIYSLKERKMVFLTYPY
jgi:hypothetical protein